MSLDAHADRTELRLRLYAGGFTPLANRRKMCLLKGWSTIEVDPALIKSRDWARSGTFKDTGLRCGDIVALDWDIDDKDLLNQMLDEVVEQGIVEESPFVRIGKPPRELWVYRTSDKIGKRTTGHFMPPGAEEGNGYAVEILGRGCQFAAYGQRDEKTDYSWPCENLLDHQFMDLPEINLKQVDALKDYAAAFFERHGLERKSPAGGTDGGYTHAYDLEPDMVLDIKDMGEVTVAEATEMLRLNPEEVLRAKADTFRPTSGSWACMISLVGGRICVSDHGTYTTHFLLEDDVRKSASALGSLLAARFPEQPVAPPVDLLMDPTDKFDLNLSKALQRFVYLSNDGLVCDITDPEFSTNTIRQFSERMAPYYDAEPGPKGGETVAYLADMWKKSHDRIDAKTLQMRPDKPRPLFKDASGQHINTYQPPSFPAGGDATTGLRMIENLLPREEERRFFMQWLSFKLAHPEVPGPAVVMVARDSYGTGRGSLISLMADMFGQRYVARVPFNTLVGRGHQSQYNEWLVDSLIVAVDEAQETEAGLSKWQARTNAYEHLKTIVDPAQRQVHVTRKTIKNTRGVTYASVFIATNHGDAMVIPPEDRRFGVLENGAPMPTSYWEGFHRWRENLANVGAFVEAMRKVDLTGYSPYAAPPMTATKADMIDAGSSDIDRGAAIALKQLTGSPLVVKEQFLLALETAMLDNGFDFPDDWVRVAERIFVRKTHKILGTDRVQIEGKLRTVRVLGTATPDLFQSPETMIELVGRNGPLTRQVKTTGRVVAFPQRG